MLRIIVTRQIIASLNLQPWIAIKGSGSRQISHEKAHTKKANSHKEAQKGRHFDNKLETYPTNFMSNDGYLTSFFSRIHNTPSILKHQSIQYQSQISIYYLS